LRSAEAATAPGIDDRLRWSSGDTADFTVRDVPRARAVLTLEQGPRVGVFLVEEGSSP
jgi:hypothetical protein